MRFSLSGLIKTLIITVFIGLVAVAVLRSFGIGPMAPAPEGTDALVKEATDALAAVRVRQPGERRPASYDAVMKPIDQLLLQINDIMKAEEFDPVADFEKVRSRALPVIDLATQGDRQARTETGFLSKEYRFNAQKGEAIQYLANTMWERILRQLPRQEGYFHEATPYPPAEMNELRRLLDMGLESAPDNRDLWYIRGVLNRAEGLYAPAARDLERSISLDAKYAAGWNTLGLVRIALKDFDKAEEALEMARALTLGRAEEIGVEPGEEYLAAVYNLATFHEGLAAFYLRENRMNQTAESKRLLAKHTDDARRYFEEFLSREPSGTADARAVQAKLQALPR